jgi:hypothetical protein
VAPEKLCRPLKGVSDMTRKFFFALFLIVSLVVGPGAFGHGHQ